MTIQEIIKYKDIKTYRKLQAIRYSKPNNKIKLGDTPENLMKHDSYRRENGAIKQKRWGR